MPPPRLSLPQNPYRLFHLSARLRLPSDPSTANPPIQPADDYYSLLLSSPTPTPSKKTINPLRVPKSTQTSTSVVVPPASSASVQKGSERREDEKGEQKVVFSAPLSGPSPRMRGLARAERGLERPPEPDNCCMSGCVNCVWDAYREEVEEWAAARRRREMKTAKGRSRGDVGREDEGDGGGAVGDLDEGYRGVDLSEEGMFEGVPVGIREFMNTEKRLKERRGRGLEREKGKGVV